MIALLLQVGSAQSQPAPRPSDGNQRNQQQAGDERTIPNPAQNGTPTVTVTNAPVITLPATNPDSKTTNSLKDAASDGWTIVAAWLLVFLTGGLIYVGLKQRDTAETQARILDATLATNKQIERAYVGFGIWLTKPTTTPPRFRRNLQFTLQLLNFGNTPATVDEIIVAYAIDPLLAEPSYRKEIYAERSRPFLVKRGQFVRRNIDFSVPITEWADATIPGDELDVEPENRPKRTAFYLLGYVRYRDRFNTRHRAGFGRVFTGTFDDPIDDSTDVRKLPERLEFITLPDYNYDEQES